MRRFFSNVGTCPTRALVFTFFGFISKFNRHFSLSVVNNFKNKSGKSHGNPAKFSQPPDERVNGLAGANVRSPFAGETKFGEFLDGKKILFFLM
jgi:hypothetical protein